MPTNARKDHCLAQVGALHRAGHLRFKSDETPAPQSYAKRPDILTAARRAHLKPGSYALPKQEEYPDEDLKHARNALSRVAADGTPAQQATVRRNVLKRFPSIDREPKG
ncbi:MAG TPA: hypothetical protein PLB88_04690 [Thermoanaerobaculaceae bacterium]|nr:hypothetical protein [Thermoanaerobaculaceae bacterium]